MPGDFDMFIFDLVCSFSSGSPLPSAAAVAREDRLVAPSLLPPPFWPGDAGEACDPSFAKRLLRIYTLLALGCYLSTQKDIPCPHLIEDRPCSRRYALYLFHMIL